MRGRAAEAELVLGVVAEHRRVQWIRSGDAVARRVEELVWGGLGEQAKDVSERCPEPVARVGVGSGEDLAHDRCDPGSG